MATRITVDVNDHGAIAQLDAYPARQAVVLARAVNRTGQWARTRTLNAITSTLAVKKSDLDGKHRFGGVTVSHATTAAPEAVLSVTGDRIPLFRFHGKPTALPEGRQRGISYQVDAGGGRKKQTLDVFLGIMKSGHPGFYKRETDAKRYKIRARHGKREGKWIWSEGPLIELYGPSIPHVAEENPEFQQLLKVDASDRLALQVEREVSFELTGTSKVPEVPEGGAQE